MQEYFMKNPVREKMDALGFHLLMLLVCCGWFALLWGLRLQALLSGGALYLLCLMVRHKTRDHRLQQREQKLRRRIGGEMKLESLLFLPSDEAHLEAVLLLSLGENLSPVRLSPCGILCQRGQEQVLVSFLQVPLCEKITARDVLSLQKAARAEGAGQVLLCAPCGVTEGAQAQCEQEVPVRILPRDTLISLFGTAAPATDQQLVQLGKRRKKPLPLGRLLPILFHPAKTRRYALYGALLLFLYLMTGFFYYALPGLICIALATIGHCRNR